MFEKVIHRLLLTRHFWRYATFNEVAELYTARLLRQTANSLIAVMSAVFLYKSGYPLLFIAMFYVLYFGFKAVLTYPSALIVARFGPKHGELFSNLLAIPSLLSLSLLAEYGVYSLGVFLVLQGLSTTLYGLSHTVSFSRVKSATHAGKEIGFMNAIDKIASGLSPLIGGLIAWLIAPEVTIWVAAGLFSVAAIPLFRTAEPVRLRQKINFSGFPWRQARAGLLANMAVGADVAVTKTVWQLFLVAVLFASSGEDAYAKIGALASVTIFVGLVVSYMFGRLIDKKRGRELMRYSAISNIAVHATRPFVSTPLLAGLVNIGNEAATTGFNMAFMRGLFDMADRSGHRIAYVLCVEMASSGGACLLFVASSLLIYMLGDSMGLALSFWVMVPLVFILARSNFPLYRR